MEKKQIFTNISEEEFKEIIRECVQTEIEKVSNTPSNKEDLIKAKEACVFLHISKVTLFKWLKEGIIKGYYLGTRLYLKKSELEEALTKKGEHHE